MTTESSPESIVQEILNNTPRETILEIASPQEKTRKKAMQAIMEQVPEDMQWEIKSRMPVSLLEGNSYEGILASVWWMTDLILDAKVNDAVLESVYIEAQRYYQIFITSEDTQENATSLKERLERICRLLKGKRPKDDDNPTSIYIDIFAARFQHDFEQDIEWAEKMYSTLEGREKEEAVIGLWSIYVELGKHEEAYMLYKKWAEKTHRTIYYKKMVTALSKLGKREEAYDIYTFYVNLIDNDDEEVVPFIVLKWSIDNDEDLAEMQIIAVSLFAEHTLYPEYKNLFESARAYIDKEMRKIHIAINNWSFDTQDASLAAQMHYSRYTQTHIMNWDNHDIWIRLLFLHAINTLVIFDNSPLRDFEIYDESGDIVEPKKDTPDETAWTWKKIYEKEFVRNAGKVEDFIDLIATLYSSTEGTTVLNEFFHRYPFTWVEKFIESLDDLYSKDSDEEKDKEEKDLKEQEDIYVPGWYYEFRWRFQHKNPIIFTKKSEWWINRENIKVEDSIDTLIAYITRTYLRGEYAEIINSTYDVKDMIEEWAGFGNYEPSENEWATTRLLMAWLDAMGEDYRAEYERVWEGIASDYGEAIRNNIIFLAIESIQMKDGIPEFVLNDYRLSWYLLMNMLLGNPNPDEKLIGEFLADNIFYADYTEESEMMNTILCSTLASMGMYGHMCNFIIEHEEYTSDPIFLDLFFLGLSYLGEEDSETFIEAFQDKISDEEEVDRDSDEAWDEEVDRDDLIENHLDMVGSSIEPDQEYADDDRAKCLLARGYFFLASNQAEKVWPLLSPIIETKTLDVVDETLTEARFLMIRAEMMVWWGSQETQITRLEEIVWLLSYEHLSECYMHIFKIALARWDYPLMKKYRTKAINKLIPIGLWEFIPWLLSDDEVEQRESIYNLQKSDIGAIPEEFQWTLLTACKKYIWSDLPLSEDYGDIKIQSAYILSRLPQKQLWDSLQWMYDYFSWLKKYLSRWRQYTQEDMKILAYIFEKSFWYNTERIEEDSSPEEIESSVRIAYYLGEHLKEFMVDVERKKEFLKEAKNTEAWTALEEIWKLALREYIEIFQRIPGPRIEEYIGYIRETYDLWVSDDIHRDEVVSLWSVYIH